MSKMPLFAARSCNNKATETHQHTQFTHQELATSNFDKQHNFEEAVAANSYSVVYKLVTDCPE